MSAQIKLPERFNVADYFILPNLTPHQSDKVFIYCGDETLTFRQLHQGANRVGNLLKDLGVKRKTRVVMLMGESLSFPKCFFGAIRIGAIPVPVNTMLTPQDYLYYLNNSEAEVLIVDAALWDQIEPIKKELNRLRGILIANDPDKGGTGNPDKGGKGKLSLDELMAGAGGELEVEMMSPADPAFWLYTSGSTGLPKAAVHLQQNMVYSAKNVGSPVFGMSKNDLSFSAPKLFFAYGLGNSLYIPLSLGGSSVINPSLSTPESVFNILTRFRPTIFFAIPSLFNGLLNLHDSWRRGEGENPPETLPELEHLRFSVSAGESLPPEIYHRWKNRFGSELLDGIGSTEVLHFFICNRPGEVRPGSAGRLVPGYQARLVDEAGKDLADGEIGALWIKGESLASDYWNNPEKTKATMLGEWLVTGDKFHRDSEGYFWYQGRNDDMMKVSGSWVSPVEVENALSSHQAVAECAVVGFSDETGLTKPKAFVILKEGNNPSPELKAALQDHVASRIAPFKKPQWMEFVATLPKTATGKIRRFVLRN